MGEKTARNEEGYPDPTFGGAWGNIRREEKQRESERLAKISDLIPVMKQTAELAGFEVVGRIKRTQDRDIKEFARYAGKKTGSAKAWQWRWESIPA